MQICRHIDEIRSTVAELRGRGSVGLVTTMGALHAGHMALVSAARADHGSVVATIFVNPTQFADANDLDNYPRTEAEDLAQLKAAGVDVVFIPNVAEIYPPGDETIVETTHLANVFHGKVRTGHFRGVATVVTKLFNIVGADAAYFGEKDYQQLAVIRRMVRDLHMPVAVHGVATVREADGLAMSSRNVRLDPRDRLAATVLHRALIAGADRIKSGDTVEATQEAIAAVVAKEPRARLRAIDIVMADSFAPATGRPEAPVGMMISAEFGHILLIDQKEVTP